MAAGRFVGTAELQGIPSNLLRDLSETGETCFITEEGRAKAVLMDINRYNALMDLVEESENPGGHDAGGDARENASVRTILRHTTMLLKRPV
jgi:hypothetical protein